MACVRAASTRSPGARKRDADQHHHQRPAAAAQQPEHRAAMRTSTDQAMTMAPETHRSRWSAGRAAPEKVVAAEQVHEGHTGVEQLEDDDDPDPQRAAERSSMGQSSGRTWAGERRRSGVRGVPTPLNERQRRRHAPCRMGPWSLPDPTVHEGYSSTEQKPAEESLETLRDGGGIRKQRNLSPVGMRQPLFSRGADYRWSLACDRLGAQGSAVRIESYGSIAGLPCAPRRSTT